jgi:hypothetical protein
VKVPAQVSYTDAAERQRLASGLGDAAMPDMRDARPNEMTASRRGTRNHAVRCIDEPVATGPPVILKVVDPSSTGRTLAFSDYDKPYPFAPPPAVQTVDFSKLENIH